MADSQKNVRNKNTNGASDSAQHRVPDMHEEGGRSTFGKDTTGTDHIISSDIPVYNKTKKNKGDV